MKYCSVLYSSCSAKALASTAQQLPSDNLGGEAHTRTRAAATAATVAVGWTGDRNIQNEIIKE